MSRSLLLHPSCSPSPPPPLLRRSREAATSLATAWRASLRRSRSCCPLTPHNHRRYRPPPLPALGFAGQGIGFIDREARLTADRFDTYPLGLGRHLDGEHGNVIAQVLAEHLICRHESALPPLDFPQDDSAAVTNLKHTKDLNRYHHGELRLHAEKTLRRTGQVGSPRLPPSPTPLSTPTPQTPSPPPRRPRHAFYSEGSVSPPPYLGGGEGAFLRAPGD
ncbi:hypothetical protein ABZP36_000356 [Zizania latifolia]